MKNATTRMLAVLAAVTPLALAGCSSDAGGTASKGELTVPVIAGWDEAVASGELWKAVLEEEGYSVNLEYADVAPVYAGLSTGDYDFYTDAWLPVTHGSYVEQFGDSMEDLGVWNDEARNTVAVNANAPIDSLEELAGAADTFGGQIIGIEAGAGLTQAVENDTIPTYGLEGMEFTTSSTAAMLTELDAAMAAGDDIVVTLWEPHWAYGTYDLKNLEDPEGTLGTAESMHVFAREDFSADYPEVAEWLSDFEMSLDQLQDLESAMFVDNDTDDYGPIVDAWIEDNREYVDSLTS
ncbi:glycine betaine ABC transporter substrate-binding protein [Microbacterium oryzae]|uniref:Glycine betaine ABC transporter substrate-binding protein n=1 Tax=Microbacterium oryzae TaxID=743009 RepID=A0A6I6DP32_9MICO|nr:glycine betaine ABC transporter substrate-binding protein [Microbacterium oryzae]QGU26645.1 glycine betaine ABC transporter substrate-binding protein [Microbacterium oryzae]